MSDTDNSMALQEQQEIFEQIAAVFEMNGIAIDKKTMAYMQPLLNGELSPEQHQSMLKTILDELTHGE